MSKVPIPTISAIYGICLMPCIIILSVHLVGAGINNCVAGTRIVVTGSKKLSFSPSRVTVLFVTGKKSDSIRCIKYLAPWTALCIGK